MTLSTHAVVGAGLAVIAKAHPASAFAIGFLSHYAIDALPHWHYKVKPFNIAIDMILACLLVLYFFLPADLTIHGIVTSPVLWGAFGALLPDAIFGLYLLYPHQKVLQVQDRFHAHFIHWSRLDDWKYGGPLLEVLFMTAVILSVRI